MSPKLQFQFAGVDLSRPSSPYRKWLRMGLMGFGVLVLALGYWQYLRHLTHGRVAPVVGVAHAAPVVVDAGKNVASASVAAVPVATVLAVPTVSDSVVSTPVTPVVSVSVSKPTAGIQITTVAPAHRAPVRAHNEQELLLMAGQTAFANALALADKYPDAYGFVAGDFISDARLGEPIPVYTIDESARANYKSGQPVKPLLKVSNRWVFPVTLNGRLCCMVQVKKNGKEFVPGTSSKSLAMSWTKILDNWPVDQGYHPQLVVNPAIPGYYFTVPELPMPNMTDTIMMTYFNPCTSPADVILASWR
jgi:hypothetical protein